MLVSDMARMKDVNFLTTKVQNETFAERRRAKRDASAIAKARLFVLNKVTRGGTESS